MAANVESMAYVSVDENGVYDQRKVPWHGLGTPVSHLMTSEEALVAAGLDWEVVPQPVSTNGVIIPGYQANVRKSDGAILGLVKDRYKIVQNKEAFDFTDALIGEGCTYETAGSLDGGKRTFLLAHLPAEKILGDEIVPYIAFTNGFNGSYCVKACLTNVRVVCQNTLNMALKGATRCWSTRHTGNIQSKLEEARETLRLAKAYTEEMARQADILANTTITENDIQQTLDVVYPLTEDMTPRQQENVKDMRNGLIYCMISPDILKFKGTAWNFVQAASDWSTHSAPKRMTANYQENNFSKVLDGNVVLDTVYFEMLKKVAQNKVYALK